MKIWTALLVALCAGQAAYAQDIVIGQSVPLSGSNADIGRDMRDGALAVFTRANANNVLARRVQLVTLDNANNRQRAAANTQQLVDQGALVLFGYNSATNSLDALPLAARHNTLFFAPFSGSSSLRTHPNVYTIRASYKAEAARIVETKRTVGSDKAVIIHYDDDVGQSNYEATAAAFTEGGLPKPPGVAVKRGAKVERAVVDQILKESPHYLLATTQFSVVRDLLALEADHGVNIPVAALSFVNPDELAESVGEMARGPQALRETQQQREKGREYEIRRAPTEEREVDEVVRDGVGIPPQADRDERHRGRPHQQGAVQQRQTNQPGIPRRMPQDARAHAMAARQAERGNRDSA